MKATNMKILYAAVLLLTLLGVEGRIGNLRFRSTPTVTTSSSNGLSRAIADFSQRLVMQLVEDQGTRNQLNTNVLISPLSVSSAMGLLWLGAAGQTRKEIEDTCKFGSDAGLEFKKLNHEAFFSPIGMKEKRKKSQVMVANNIFYDWSKVLKVEFRNKAYEYHHVEARGVDFKRHPELSRKIINWWVSNSTRGIIREMLSPRDVTRATGAVLTNVVLFRGAWRNQFDARKTRMETFTTASGRKIQAPMMYLEKGFRYRLMCPGEHPCMRVKQPDVIEIPYANGKHVMIILLSNPQFSLEDIEKNVTKEYKGWRSDLVRGDIVLTMPKFRVYYQANLESALHKLGIRQAFHGNTANFENMCSSDLSFTKFIHKASIIVDETGTSAAASSALIGILRKASPSMHFAVNRPFLFFIEDIKTGVQLFSGRITDPTKP